MSPNPFARRSTKSIKELIEVSSGRIPADISLENARIINVYSGEIIEGNVAIFRDRIAGVGPRYKATKKINLRGRYIAPGFIDVGMTASIGEEDRENVKQLIPLNRMGTPDDVAGVVRFLVSEEAAYMTGQTLHVNGGLYM